ncbi:TAXI family TRAP transporter solute-binding subunit [Mariniblastus fucicola]|uniref:NMT1/THI5 like protein n=1 Tax=Mariniblastus fucicola TaxID=980251 RepID=A0A5B9PLI4_9BACT|nr:TAXI family TRAP transporter solute-binding subunit [Mariniblastus fucicola]QEG23531.1 NMT1/THI5 like protein [Mariniblastus fucicola]
MQGKNTPWNFVKGLTVAALVAVSFSGCDSNPKAAGDGDENSTGGRQFITLGTAPSGGAFAPVGNAIAGVVDANKGDRDWVVTPKKTKGTQENIRKLQDGDIQFGMANAAISYFAVKGEGAWETPHEIRTVATIAPNVGVFVTTEATGIKTIADLKGKRVVLGPAGAGFDYFLKPLFEAHGLTYEDMTVLPGNYLEAGDMIADKKADAAFMGGAIPIPAVTQLCSTQDIVFVKLDDDAPEKLKAYPFYAAVPVKADAYSDLNEDFIGLNVGNMQLVTHANVDEDLVYDFTKLMYENRAKVAEKHPAAKAINEKNAARNTGTPFHPGAIKFYKEIGIWPAE